MKYREQPQTQKDQVKKDLNNCESLGEMLTYLQKNYHLNGVRPGITKHIYVQQLTSLLNNLNPEKNGTP